MFRRSFLMGLALLAACSPPAQKAAPPPVADPAAVIQPIYARYMPGAPEFQYANLEDQAPWSASLKQAMIDQERRFAAVTDGDPEGIDFDVFVNAQDWQISHVNVASENVVPEHSAIVHARFDNADSHEDVTYSMIWENGGWRIDDMRSGAGDDGWDLRQLVSRTS